MHVYSFTDPLRKYYQTPRICQAGDTHSGYGGQQEERGLVGK